MALFKYLRWEGPVCELGTLSKETEQVNECVRPLECNGENVKADQKHGAYGFSVFAISRLQLRCSLTVDVQIAL